MIFYTLLFNGFSKFKFSAVFLHNSIFSIDSVLNLLSLCSLHFVKQKLIKVHSDLEMSDFSSHLPVNEENSGCESESDSEQRNEGVKTKNRRKRKNPQQQQQRDPVATTSNNTDDETESQLNFEESPVNSTPYTSPVTLHYQDKMRRRLQFFFMNPIEKWQAKRR